jgi:hypothetical protein
MKSVQRTAEKESNDLADLSAVRFTEWKPPLPFPSSKLLGYFRSSAFRGLMNSPLLRTVA